MGLCAVIKPATIITLSHSANEEQQKTNTESEMPDIVLSINQEGASYD